MKPISPFPDRGEILGEETDVAREGNLGVRSVIFGGCAVAWVPGLRFFGPRDFGALFLMFWSAPVIILLAALAFYFGVRSLRAKEKRRANLLGARAGLGMSVLMAVVGLFWLGIASISFHA